MIKLFQGFAKSLNTVKLKLTNLLEHGNSNTPIEKNIHSIYSKG